MSTDFAKMTVKELKSYAKTNNIDLGTATKKSEIVAAINGVKATVSVADKAEGAIMAPPATKSSRIPNVVTNDEGAIIVRSAERHKKVAVIEQPKEKDLDVSNKVALWSDGNIHWIGVGHIKKGYNIVTKEASEKWLTRRSIRLATPDEVATYYGK